MKVGVAVIGYESKNEIARCLDPFVGHVDAFILGDGKFDFYDAPNQYSKDGWLNYAHDRYKDKLQVETYRYAGSQVVKRQKYLDIAGEIGLDYLIVMDTDDYLMADYQDWPTFYSNLSKAEGRIFLMYSWIPDADSWSKQTNKGLDSNTWQTSRRIHKDPGTMRFCLDCHYMWCSKETTDEEILGWTIKNPDKPNQNPYQFYSNTVIDGVRFTCDRKLRTPEQIKEGTYWAYMNSCEENMRQYYLVAKLKGLKPPGEFKTWEEYINAPHTFNAFGRRVELI